MKGAITMAIKSLDSQITAVIKSTHNTAATIHAVAVMCLAHAKQHNDPRKLDRLYTGIHKATRPEALKAWVEKFSPVRWSGDGKVGMLKENSKKYVPFDVKGADAEPYWTPSETVKKPLTLAALKAIIAQMEKKLNSAEDNDLIADGENVIEMRAFVKRMTETAAIAA